MNAENTLVLLGNVGSEESIRSFQNDEGKTTVVSFSLAVTEYRYNKETSQNEKMTDWHNVKAFGWVANRIEQFVQKGQRMLLTGRLYKEQYTDADGNTRYDVGMEVDNFTLVSGGGERNSPAAPAGTEEDEFPF